MPSFVLRGEAARRIPLLDLDFDSMPGPKFITIDPFARGSSSAGTNHAVSPGPVAIACHTSSGVPGTSVSAAMKRRPDGSF
jgi:hypothetical protein